MDCQVPCVSAQAEERDNLADKLLESQRPWTSKRLIHALGAAVQQWHLWCSLQRGDKCYHDGLDKETLWTGRTEILTGRLDQGGARAQEGQAS